MGKALRLLELLGEHPGGLTAAGAARICGHRFCTAYRLLSALVRDGFAELPEDRRCVLGLTILHAAQAWPSAAGSPGRSCAGTSSTRSSSVRSPPAERPPRAQGTGGRRALRGRSRRGPP
ncbi:helix-turn-helix domain-containing protein [uncultured Kocuria sp.]|uniref:helix-turn-helix domain-containing protein n=1 Tax=uncultured Kocuria sp. TaxID=259305 RepID=UPI0026043113|nr:helix-turn-helix domain-containing protein [uncultured Kocuria sp.]